MPRDIFACYVLWDILRSKPVYVGTARNRGRLRAHLKKDTVRDGKVGLTYRNPEFLAFVMAQPAGWLGMSIDLFDNEADMRKAEIERIARFALKRDGGSLFNRSRSG